MVQLLQQRENEARRRESELTELTENLNKRREVMESEMQQRYQHILRARALSLSLYLSLSLSISLSISLYLSLSLSLYLSISLSLYLSLFVCLTV